MPAAAPSRPSPPRERRSASPPPNEADETVSDDPGERGSPSWVRNLQRPPDEATLKQLAEEVARAPFDRDTRNRYADALTRAARWGELDEVTADWARFDSDNPAAYEHLGRAAKESGKPDRALRAYGSVAEVAPSNAALLARAGYLMLAAKQFDTAVTLFEEAVDRRPDQPNSHRGLGLALLLAGRFAQAATVLKEALGQTYHSRYGDVHRVLREELGYVLRAWLQDPKTDDREQARKLASELNVDLDRSDALRVTLIWETDANDVDLHVVDPKGEECFYSHMSTRTGLQLYSDQTRGLGPEVIRSSKTVPGEYHAGVKYFAAGPMGVSRGVLVILVPKEGLASDVRILPFSLLPIPGQQDMRLLATVKVE